MHGQQTCYTSTLVCFLAVLYLDDIFHTMFAAGFEISRASICQFASFYPSVNPSILPSGRSCRSLSQAHCLALLKDGRLLAWGSNPQGQVGNGFSSLENC